MNHPTNRRYTICSWCHYTKHERKQNRHQIFRAFHCVTTLCRWRLTISIHITRIATHSDLRGPSSWPVCTWQLNHLCYSYKINLYIQFILFLKSLYINTYVTYTHQNCYSTIKSNSTQTFRVHAGCSEIEQFVLRPAVCLGLLLYTVEPLITDTAGEFKFCPL
jgi:hypothetical protein